MLKKEIKYIDLFSNEEVTETFYFHLTEAELVELELSHRGGLVAAMDRIMAAKDAEKLILEFKQLVLLAYGERSQEGKFIKSQALRDEFASTPAYSKFFMELVTNTDSAIEFINGIVPPEMAADVAKRMAEVKAQQEKENQEEREKREREEKPVDVPNVEKISKEHFDGLTGEEKVRALERMASGELAIQLDAGELTIKPGD